MLAPYETGVQSVVPNSILSLRTEAGSGIGWIKFRSGTKSQPINQTSDRQFLILFN